MDGRGGCCIARYTAAGGGGGAAGGGGGGAGVGVAYDLSKIDRIMLRYRPIAPKPTVGGGPVLRDDQDVSGKTTGGGGSGGGRGGRRRCVKDGSKKGCVKKRKTSPPVVMVEGEQQPTPPPPVVVTLPLLPETPDTKESPATGGSSSSESAEGGVVRNMVRNSPIWLSFGDSATKSRHGSHVSGFGGVMTPSPKVVLTSWVKVECVTDTWVDSYALGCTDEEKVVNLYKDTCPGFISDGENRVRWCNHAYNDMVGGREVEAEEVVAFLGLKEGTSLPSSCNAFTCRVKAVAFRKDRIKNEHKNVHSLTLPCDVWRLESGGFAWRLDTKAALSLSLGR